MSVRHKLLLTWLGSVLLVLGLLAGLVVWQLQAIHRETFRNLVESGFRAVAAEMESRRESLGATAGTLASQKDVVATAHLIARYEDPESYRELIFDPEKRRLARVLRRRAQAAHLDFAAVYAGAEGVAALYAARPGAPPLTAFRSYAGGEPVLRHQPPGARKARTVPAPGLLKTPMRAASGEVVTWAAREGLALEAVARVSRPDNGSGARAGTLRVIRLLRPQALARIAGRYRLGLSMMLPDGPVHMKNGPAVPPGLSPGSLPSLRAIADGDAAPLTIQRPDTFLAGARVTLDGGGSAALLVGLPKAQLMVQRSRLAWITLGVLAMTALVLAPLGAWLLDRMISRPLRDLLTRVRMLESGEAPEAAPPPPAGNDEVARLARAFDGMDRTVREREEALRESVDLLTRTNADLERFTYMASHDLQEPLRNVASYAQLLKRRYKGELGADADQYIDYLVAGARQMKDLVADVAEYLQVSRQTQRAEPVDLNHTVATARDRLTRPDAVIHVAPLPTVHGDPGQLYSVFENLLSNAVKFVPGNRTPHVHVSAEPTADGHAVHVTDNGEGIAPAYQDIIFQPFRRLHTADTYPGTGVGLALCNAIVARHGGSLRIASTPGEGTTVTVMLPEWPETT